MSEKQNILTIEDLKTYLYSLEQEKEEVTEEKTNIYKSECEQKEKEVKDKQIQKIQDSVNKEYDKKIQTRTEILNLLNEVAVIPSEIEKVESIRYIANKINIKKSVQIVKKANARIGRKYNKIVDDIQKKVKTFPKFEKIEEINFSIYNTNGEELKKVKENFKTQYTEEEKKEFIQKELDIIQKSKVFNTTPLPYEILKNSDRDMQSKMQKFNKSRQKRLRTISTMEQDYAKLIEPRVSMHIIDEALAKVEEVKDIFIKFEYTGIKNSFIKTRKKIYKTTSETRSIIKYKEKKTGILFYNIQEARYDRMDKLRGIIAEATNTIKINSIPGGEEQLEKLKISYEREKQFASVIEKLDEEADMIPNNEVKILKEQITNLQERISKSKEIISEQEEIISKAKKELVILWKIEIDSTISKKKETLELPEETASSKKKEKGLFLKLRKVQNEKHACV